MKDTHDLIDGKVVRKATVSKERAFAHQKKGWQHSTFLNFLAGLVAIGWFGATLIDGHQQDVQRAAEFKEMKRCVVNEDTSTWLGSGCDKFIGDPMYELLLEQRYPSNEQ